MAYSKMPMLMKRTEKRGGCEVFDAVVVSKNTLNYNDTQPQGREWQKTSMISVSSTIYGWEQRVGQMSWGYNYSRHVITNIMHANFLPKGQM